MTFLAADFRRIFACLWLVFLISACSADNFLSSGKFRFLFLLKRFVKAAVVVAHQ